MMDTLLLTLLALTCRASVALPIAIVIYLVWQRQRRGIPLYPQFIFWFAVAAALFVALQWIVDGPAWLHVIIFGLWGTAVMTCMLAGLKEIEEASIEIAKASAVSQAALHSIGIERMMFSGGNDTLPIIEVAKEGSDEQ